jgi:hypothetical protein
VVLLVDGEDGRVRDLRVTNLDDPFCGNATAKSKREKTKPFQYDCSKWEGEIKRQKTSESHFFSPSNKRNDSNVGGAFILNNALRATPYTSLLKKPNETRLSKVNELPEIFSKF